jgi:phospholipid transport system substrate-binding protein
MRRFTPWKSKRRLIAALFILLVLVAWRAEAATPSEVVRKFNASLLEAMKKADELGYQGRYKLLGPVIRDSFDLSFMAGQSAGRHWRTLNDSQKSQLVETFTDWTVATYAARFDGYSGEKFEIASESSPRDGIATVVSKLIKSDNGEIVFYYLLKKSGASWRIIDIQISGVSQLALTRAQFSDVLKTKGVDGLIAMLKGKVEEYSKGEKK